MCSAKNERLQQFTVCSGNWKHFRLLLVGFGGKGENAAVETAGFIYFYQGNDFWLKIE